MKICQFLSRVANCGDSREGVSSNIVLSRPVLDVKLILQKFESPAGYLHILDFRFSAIVEHKADTFLVSY